MLEILYIVVPCYNEEETLSASAAQFSAKLTELIEKGAVDPQSRILFVDDGSRDSTWRLILGLSKASRLFKGLRLGANSGHQAALMAGLSEAAESADLTLSIDADLQDPLSALDAMLEKRREGCDIVYGVRSERGSDSVFKRQSAELFYRMLASFGARTVHNHADFRLMSRTAVLRLMEFGERSLYLRGLVPMLGLRAESVYYEREPRRAGESKYSLSRMLSLGFDALGALSEAPFRIMLVLGALAFLLGLVLLIVLAFSEVSVWGAKGAFASVWLLGGLVLGALGVLGEYLWRVNIETRRRPKAFVAERAPEERAEPSEARPQQAD